MDHPAAIPESARGRGSRRANHQHGPRHHHKTHSSRILAPTSVTDSRATGSTVVDRRARLVKRAGKVPCSVQGCESTFSRPGDQQRHIKDIHMDEKEVCQYCSYRCRGDKMRVHLRSCSCEERQGGLADIPPPISFPPEGRLRAFLPSAELTSNFRSLAADFSSRASAYINSIWNMPPLWK